MIVILQVIVMLQVAGIADRCLCLVQCTHVPAEMTDYRDDGLADGVWLYCNYFYYKL